MPDKTIYTIGHSTRSMEEFVSLLKSFEIELLVDIRTLPGSRKYPHFNQENLSVSLRENGMNYEHMIGLGGRRKPMRNSTNTVWRNASFRGYADYMQTEEFAVQISILEARASSMRTAYMCSEAVWWKCHRALVSDYLKLKHWIVMHITDVCKATEHPFTTPAREKQGNLF